MGFEQLTDSLRLLLCTAVLLASTAVAAPAANTPQSMSVLQQLIEQAAPNSELSIPAGSYHGQLRVNKSLSLRADGEVKLIGDGKGRVVTLDAADIRFSGFHISHSGEDASAEDAGIFVTAAADRAEIHHNVLQHNLIGVYLKGPEQAKVHHNRISGRADLRPNDRGNGVYVWNSPGSVVEHNHIRSGRDGIYVMSSRDNVFRHNELRELRFAIHYMYTNHSEVSDNLSVGNTMGYAIMFSHHLEVHRNRSVGDRDRGLLLNYTNYSNFSGNRVAAAEDGAGPEKCLFIYNANGNRFNDNHFAHCQIGIHFTAGSEGNRLSGNSFVDNRNQVKYVGSRQIEWSDQGRGNYWSDNLGFDLNGDGFADRPYSPNDLVDQLIWRYSSAKLLLNSPAVAVVRWSQSQFPSLYPGGVIDSYPLMREPDEGRVQ